MEESKIIQAFYGDDQDPHQLDDCALLPSGDLVTTDSMAEGIHFRLDWSRPEDVAVKLFTANLSDLSASGGSFQWALLNMGLPDQDNRDFVIPFAKQLQKEVHENGGRIVGGDTHRGASMNLTLTMGGGVLRHLERKTIHDGDVIYLSGPIGLSLLGYEILSKKGIVSSPELEKRAVDRHLRPRINLELRTKLVLDPRVHAAMDLSDGLAQDLPRLALASRRSIRIDLEKIPLAPGIEKDRDARFALQSGEEFELLFSGAPGLEKNYPEVFPIGVAVSQSPDPGVQFLEQGKEVVIKDRGYQHFRKGGV